MPLLDNSLFKLYSDGLSNLLDEITGVESRERIVPPLSDPPSPTSFPEEHSPIAEPEKNANEESVNLSVPEKLPYGTVVSLKDAIRRHREIEGVFGIHPSEPSEQLLYAMSRFVSEKTRSIQITREKPVKPVQRTDLPEILAFEAFLSSPQDSVESKLRIFDPESIPPREPKIKNAPTAHWNAPLPVRNLILDFPRKENPSDPGITSEKENGNLCANEVRIEEEPPSPSESNAGETGVEREIPVERGTEGQKHRSRKFLATIPRKRAERKVRLSRPIPSVSPRTAARVSSPVVNSTQLPQTPQFLQSDRAPEEKTVLEIFGAAEKPSRIEVAEWFPALSAKICPVSWPTQCERMREEAAGQVERLVDHLGKKMKSGLRTIALCGNRPGSGCSTILLCCAKELARRGWSTLMIDGHFEHPCLAQMLGVPIGNGWESLWSGENASRNVLWTVRENLELMPLCVQTRLEAKKAFSENKMLPWVRRLSQRYEITLIDAGHFGSCLPSNIDSKLSEIVRFGADGILLVFSGHSGSFEEIAPVERKMHELGISRIGIAENYVYPS